MAQPVVPTATTVLDSILFRDAFGTPRMREIFSDYALISRYVEVEVALARAEARCGVIPTEAAEEIAAKSQRGGLRFRPPAPRDRHRRLSDPAARASARENSAARPVATCTGARRPRTSWTPRTCCRSARRSRSSRQDIADLRADPRRSRQEAPRHADGRAAPTCSRRCRSPSATRPRSGWRCSTAMPSVWQQLKPRVLVGAVRRRGRHARLARRQGPRGAEGAVRGARLGVPASTWHVARDGFAEAVNLLGADHRLARQDRARHDDHGLDRVRRGVRALRQGARRQQHHAAEAQPDLVAS